MKKRLLLLTAGFPFGESERCFLSEEVKHLAEAFDLLVMAPENRDKLIYPTDGIVKILRYRIPAFRDSIRLPMLGEVLQPATLAELAKCLKKNRFSCVKQSVQEIIYFRFCAWEIEKQIAQLVEQEQIDIVYSYWSTPTALAAANLKMKYPHLKVVTRFHGVDLYEERRQSHWQPFRRQLMEQADGLCFACLYGRSYFMERWGTQFAEKMRLHYLGSADYGMVEPDASGELCILSCSNLIPLKRVELIIEGLALLPDSLRVRWHHVGDGTEREKMEKLAAEKLAPRQNISRQFHGYVSNSMLADTYRIIKPDLFVTTSSTEGGAPVSIQEVFSMGIPAIGTEVGGIPDLIMEGKTGFLLPQEAEPAHVANAICRFTQLSHDERLQMRGAARQHWAEKFDAKKNAAEFTQYLLELVSK